MQKLRTLCLKKKQKGKNINMRKPELGDKETN